MNLKSSVAIAHTLRHARIAGCSGRTEQSPVSAAKKDVRPEPVEGWTSFPSSTEENRFNTMAFPEGQAQHSIQHGGGLDN